MSHRAKKSLGQHFLRSAGAVRSIVAAGNLTPSDTVLEIGPGEGVLTHALLETGAKVIAVEKDADLLPILAERFASEITSGQLTIIEQDVLLFEPTKHGLKANTYKLIANIPYYITGAIFEKFLTEENPPNTIVVLIQKEVATRIVARDNKESILSLSVKAFGIPKLIAKVPASAFRPAPKVDSAILAITQISNTHFREWGIPTDEATTKFFKVVKAGFAHKRKLLVRNLETVTSKETISQAFEKNNLSPKTRAEDINLIHWIALAKSL